MTLSEEQQNQIAMILFLGGFVEKNVGKMRSCDCQNCTSAVAVFDMFRERISSIELLGQIDASKRKLS